jgi:uncharacterized protein YbbK (DUF523 family)
MKIKPVIGISGCLTGSAVRFDGGHKRMGFVMNELADWVSFRPVCPEMAIGLPVPRPALRLVQTESGETCMRFTKDITDSTMLTPALRFDHHTIVGNNWITTSSVALAFFSRTRARAALMAS